VILWFDLPWVPIAGIFGSVMGVTRPAAAYIEGLPMLSLPFRLHFRNRQSFLNNQSGWVALGPPNYFCVSLDIDADIHVVQPANLGESPPETSSSHSIFFPGSQLIWFNR
jgi:hypothetical protein